MTNETSVLDKYQQSQRKKLAELEHQIWLEVAPVLIEDFFNYDNVLKEMSILVNITFRSPPIRLSDTDPIVTVEAPVLQFQREVKCRQQDIMAIKTIYTELTNRYERNNPGCVLIVMTKEIK